MLIESSLHVSTVATTAKASVIHYHHPLSIKEKIKNLPTINGPRLSKSSMSSSFSPSSLYSFTFKNLGSRFVCKAREATNTGSVHGVKLYILSIFSSLVFSFFALMTGKVSAVQAVTEGNWNELVMSSNTLVLVDFWAPWCGPCRMIAPVVDELAKEYAGKVQCYKLNTDDCPNIPTQLGIRSIPTVLFFKNGERKESIIGAVPKSNLAATIDKFLDG